LKQAKLKRSPATPVKRAPRRPKPSKHGRPHKEGDHDDDRDDDD
jgi:hypothetical protein